MVFHKTIPERLPIETESKQLKADWSAFKRWSFFEKREKTLCLWSDKSVVFGFYSREFTVFRIIGLGTDAKEQGQGIGKLTLRYLLKQLDTRCKDVYTITFDGVPFYTRCGFWFDGGGAKGVKLRYKI